MIIPNIWENRKCFKPPTRYRSSIPGSLLLCDDCYILLLLSQDSWWPGSSGNFPRHRPLSAPGPEHAIGMNPQAQELQEASSDWIAVDIFSEIHSSPENISNTYPTKVVVSNQCGRPNHLPSPWPTSSGLSDIVPVIGIYQFMNLKLGRGYYYCIILYAKLWSHNHPFS